MEILGNNTSCLWRKKIKLGKTNQNKSRSFEDSTKNTGKPTIARRLLCLRWCFNNSRRSHVVTNKIMYKLPDFFSLFFFEWRLRLTVTAKDTVTRIILKPQTCRLMLRSHRLYFPTNMKAMHNSWLHGPGDWLQSQHFWTLFLFVKYEQALIGHLRCCTYLHWLP